MIDFNAATGITLIWLSENTELSDADLTEHTFTFMREAYDPTRLGSNWGYTPELAVEGQVIQYARDVIGWSDPREGA